MNWEKLDLLSLGLLLGTALGRVIGSALRTAPSPTACSRTFLLPRSRLHFHFAHFLLDQSDQSVAATLQFLNSD